MMVSTGVDVLVVLVVVVVSRAFLLRRSLFFYV